MRLSLQSPAVDTLSSVALGNQRKLNKKPCACAPQQFTGCWGGVKEKTKNKYFLSILFLSRLLLMYHKLFVRSNDPILKFRYLRLN